MAFVSAAGASMGVRDLDSEQLSWLKGWYFFLRVTTLSFLPWDLFLFLFSSWMNHLFHMGCDGKPFLPKFVIVVSKLQLALITMVTCISAPCQGAPVNANQLRKRKWFLFLLAYKSVSADFFFPSLVFSLTVISVHPDELLVLHWAGLMPNAPGTAWPINQRSWPSHFPLTIELIQNTLIIQVPLFREQHR